MSELPKDRTCLVCEIELIDSFERMPVEVNPFGEDKSVLWKIRDRVEGDMRLSSRVRVFHQEHDIVLARAIVDLPFEFTSAALDRSFIPYTFSAKDRPLVRVPVRIPVAQVKQYLLHSWVVEKSTCKGELDSMVHDVPLSRRIAAALSIAPVVLRLVLQRMYGAKIDLEKIKTENDFRKTYILHYLTEAYCSTRQRPHCGEIGVKSSSSRLILPTRHGSEGSRKKDRP